MCAVVGAARPPHHKGARPPLLLSSASFPFSPDRRPPPPKKQQHHHRNDNSERELAAVKIAKEDVEVLAEQVEVDAKAAERRLRECGGDLGRALKSYLPSAPAAAV